ncbi:MAG: hypothetical protein ACI8PT_000783 [Gammaproteobacteria bacterium]|jgi:hypothetical protein
MQLTNTIDNTTPHASQFSAWMVCLTLVIALFAAQTTPANAASRAGEVKSLRGSAVAKGTDGSERELARGDDIFSGDRIDTAARSFVLVRFDDSTRFALGQNGSMNVSDFVFENPNKPDNIATQVLKGAFRFVSGLISKRRPSAMRVRLGVIATIGLRGTSVGGEVIGDSATVMLLDPETGEPSGIDVSNDFGSVSIDQPGFGTEILDANSPPSAPRRMRLRAIQNLMRTMQSVGRVSVPRPRPHMR